MRDVLNVAKRLHCKEDPIYIFPEMKLRGFVSNFDIHVSVSDLYIPSVALPIFCRWTNLGNIYVNRSQIHECGNWERGRAVSFLGIFVLNFRYSVFAVYKNTSILSCLHGSHLALIYFFLFYISGGSHFSYTVAHNPLGNIKMTEHKEFFANNIKVDGMN
jgi:hypothetical protein